MLKKLLPAMVFIVGMVMADDVIVTRDYTVNGRIVGIDSTYIRAIVAGAGYAIRRIDVRYIVVEKARADSLTALEANLPPPYLHFAVGKAQEDSLTASFLRAAETPEPTTSGPTTPNPDVFAGTELKSASMTALWGFVLSAVGGTVVALSVDHSRTTAGKVGLVVGGCTCLAAVICEIVAWVKIGNAGAELRGF